MEEGPPAQRTDHSLQALATEEGPQVPQRFKPRVLESGAPAHARLGGEKGKRVVGREQEPMPKLGACFPSVVIRLLIEIQVSSWPDNVAAFAHRVPVFFKRSSSRRCFSSQ